MRPVHVAVALIISLAPALARAQDASADEKPAAAAPVGKRARKHHVHSARCGCRKQAEAWLKAHPEAAPRAVGPASAATSAALSRAGAGRNAVPAMALQPMPAAPGRANAPAKLWGEGGAQEELSADSVYRLNPAVDGMVIAAGVLGSVGPWLLQDRIIHPKGLGDPTTLNSLDQSVVGNHSAGMALASNATTLAALVAPLAIDLVDVGWGQTLFEDGVVMTEVLSMTGLGVSYAKYTFQRRSPSLYLAGNVGAVNDTSQYRSFVSWQTATTFASLSALSYTLSARHDLGVLPWVGTLLVGSSVALERVKSGGAFYTDVIAGALIGTAVGTVVPWLHQRSGFDLSVSPTREGGVMVGGGKRF